MPGANDFKRTLGCQAVEKGCLSKGAACRGSCALFNAQSKYMLAMEQEVRMLVNITFEVDTDDPKETNNIIRGRLYELLTQLHCKHPAQLVTSLAETSKVGGQFVES